MYCTSMTAMTRCASTLVSLCIVGPGWFQSRDTTEDEATVCRSSSLHERVVRKSGTGRKENER